MVSIETRSDNSLGDIFLYITILYYLHDFFIKTRDRNKSGIIQQHEL